MNTNQPKFQQPLLKSDRVATLLLSSSFLLGLLYFLASAIAGSEPSDANRLESGPNDIMVSVFQDFQR